MAGRPRRFGVQCRVQVPVPDLKGPSSSSSVPPIVWCLIYEDHAPGQGSGQGSGSGQAQGQGQLESVKAGLYCYAEKAETFNQYMI